MAQLANAVKSMLTRLGYDILPKKQRVTYLGKDYIVRSGTIDDGDYDDAWMFALAHHATVIFDIGSNIGQSAFNMLQAPTVECIVLVDPAPLALTIAADTLIRNGMGHRIKFVNAFVSDKEEEIINFYTTGHDTGGHEYKENNLDADHPFVLRIATTTLDALVRKLKVIPDFVKIDAEGHEENVLLGGTHLAAQTQTRFMLEMHHKQNRPQRQVTESVLRWCVNNHYAAWYLKEGERLTTAESVAHRGRYHLMLQPEAWEYPDWLRGIAQGAPTSIVLELMR